jgi:Restriction endonuclease
MAPRKPHIARTYAPIHFDDLDPHRFEDLIRELIYDFKEWQAIEATSRAGSDDGFDIRAFEKVARVTPLTDDDDEDDPHPMDGRRWMIQGKREKTIGPADLKKILADVDENDPPYGYILAASAVFSKKSYDVFREILRTKGVMEFYAWGSPELEDMLHLPKNDRILFTFFGLSLVTRRRSRTTEVRSAVIVKNKLHKVLGEPADEFSTYVLIRDINDIYYPYKGKYPDFNTNPRWVEREAFAHYPRGYVVHVRKHFAYVDRDLKEWNFTDDADLLYRKFAKDEGEEETNRAKIQRIRDLIDFLPRSKQGDFHLDGLVLYDDVVLVDPEGDRLYQCPHIYVDFSAHLNNYAGTRKYLSVGEANIEITDEWKRVEYFKTASRVGLKPPTTQDQRIVDLDGETIKAHLKGERDAETLYAIDDRYHEFHRGDIIPLRGEHKGETHYFRITHIQRTTLNE